MAAIHRLALVSCLAACGRGHVLLPGALTVQVVDERDAGVPSADVELRVVEAGGERRVGRVRADADGVAIFPWPGEGLFELEATTDLRCCLHQGSARITLSEPPELVVLDTVTGPCPTVVPESCS